MPPLLGRMDHMSKEKRPQSKKKSQSPDSPTTPGAELEAPAILPEPTVSQEPNVGALVTDGALAIDGAPVSDGALASDSAPATETALATDADKIPLAQLESVKTESEPVKAEGDAVKTGDTSAEVIFQAKTTLRQDAISKIIFWIKDQKTLFDAFLVALSFHVVMFPMLWFVGWALPWPKPPVVTTIVEFDLDQWLKSGKPKKIFEFRDPELNQ